MARAPSAGPHPLMKKSSLPAVAQPDGTVAAKAAATQALPREVSFLAWSNTTLATGLHICDCGGTAQG